ncbi:ribonuclease H-like domain-containing protein, partial [Tanacetum coccineum]
FVCLGYGKRFFKSKGVRGGRGVKEKKQGDGGAPSGMGVVRISNTVDDVGKKSDGGGNGVDVVVLVESIRAISERFANTSYDFFLGKHVAYSVVANYVRNTWGKYGLVKSMLNSSTGIFSFQFSSMQGLDAMLENEDVGNVPVWVKLHGVLVTAFSEDDLSIISTKLGTPLMLDSYTSAISLAKLLKGVPIGPKVGFKPAKQVYRQVSKKNNVNTNGNKKKDVEPTIEVSNSNPFDVLNSVENNVDLGTNEKTSNLASKKANSSGSSFWNVDSSSTSTTPIVKKIDKMKRLIINGKVTLVDDEGKPLTRIDSSGDHDSEDEVASVDNDMTNFLASKEVGYGQDIPDKIQDICDNLDIKVRGQLLTKEILPEVKDAFVIISREESYRGIHASSIKSEKPQVFAFVSRTNDNNSKRTNRNWSNNNGSNVNKANYDSLLCKNHGLKGHTIDRCFQIIGYPPGFKRNPNLKPSGNFNNNKTSFANTKGTFVGNNDVKTSAGTVSLSNEQVMKLMSLLNEKNGSSANAHMACMVPGYSVSLLSVNKLIKDIKLSVCFDETKCYIQDLKREKVLRIGSESARLYLFDSDFPKSAMCINREIPIMFWTECVLTATYLINRLPSSVLNGKSSFSLIYGREPNISHLRSFGCLCFATVVKMSDKFSHRDVKFYETVFPYKMSNNESVNESDNVPTINFFGYFEVELETKTSNLSPNDEVEGSPGRDDENNNSEGNVGSSYEVPIFQNDLPSVTEEVGPRRSQRASKLPVRLNEFILDNKVKYGLNKYANHSMLSPENYSFVSNMNKSDEPSSYEEASKDVNWINAINEKMHALYENKTCIVTDLPIGRKPFGSKWVFRIKYKSNGEVKRYKARLVAKGFGQREGIDYEETFSHVVKMSTAPRQWNHKLSKALLEVAFLNKKFKIKDLGELKYFLGIEVLKTKSDLCLSQRKYCLELLHKYGLLACRPVMTPLPENLVLSHKEYDTDNHHMHAPLKSHFDIALRVLKYLKLAPRLGVEFTKRKSDYVISAFSDSDWAKYLVTRRSMASTTCEIMWIVKILGEFGIENVVPVELFCDNQSAIQIVANPVMHEKTKHFDIDIHLVREKVASGLIKTMKVVLSVK